jgi:hypothetical protein
MLFRLHAGNLCGPNHDRFTRWPEMFRDLADELRGKCAVGGLPVGLKAEAFGGLTPQRYRYMPCTSMRTYCGVFVARWLDTGAVDKDLE